jgi:hypothetical protein
MNTEILKEKITELDMSIESKLKQIALLREGIQLDKDLKKVYEKGLIKLESHNTNADQ